MLQITVTHVQYTQSWLNHLNPGRSKSGQVDPSWIVQVVSLKVRSHKRQSNEPSSFLKQAHKHDSFCTIFTNVDGSQVVSDKL